MWINDLAVDDLAGVPQLYQVHTRGQLMAIKPDRIGPVLIDKANRIGECGFVYRKQRSVEGS